MVEVERSGAGVETRQWRPPSDEHGTSTCFLGVNRKQRSVALDLPDEACRERARALVAESGVVWRISGPA
ncbi:hypothetical protein GCM10010234_53340 [Streptomyces hawaiiensis]|uniref:CoA transferase n=1 Tax=Streptomyces hawaiiensis TaxID=67305 RepID=UPI0031E414FB